MAQLKSLTIGGSPVADFITSTGTTEGWFYRKWNSGKIELYKEEQKAFVISEESSTVGYLVNNAFAIPSSLGLKSIITTNVTIDDNLCWTGGVKISTDKTALTYTIFRIAPHSSTIVAYINAYILGYYV